MEGAGSRSRVHVVGGVFYVRLNQLVFNPLFLPDNNKRLTAAAKNNTIIITRPFRVRFRCRHRCRRQRFHIIYIIHIRRRRVDNNCSCCYFAGKEVRDDIVTKLIRLPHPFCRNPRGPEQNILLRVCVLSI